jgi:hypothetical protein
VSDQTLPAAIVAEAIAWARARDEHWRLARATYAATGLPDKAAYADLMEAARRVDQHEDRLHDLALAALETVNDDHPLRGHS